MEFFFEPEGIAVIGASATPGKIGHEILRSIASSGYRGGIFPVNPRVEEIAGFRTYPSITEIEDRVDLAVMVIPASKLVDIMVQSREKGVKGVVIISGGFKEMGEEGAALEREAVRIAREGGMRIIGPNCIGIFNGIAGIDTFFQPREAMIRPRGGNIAFMTQSGTYGAALLEWIAAEGLGVSKFVSYGNKSDVDEIDLLDYLADDDETRVIAIYLEGLEDGRSFLDALDRVLPKKPVVILKAGRSEKGAAAAKSHTGSMAGNFAVFEGVMTQRGVILVDDLEEMFDAVKILSLQPIPNRGHIAIVTNGVGPCVVAADELDRHRFLDMPDLPAPTVERLKEELPGFMVVRNPLDLTGSARAEHYRTGIDALIGPDFDIILPFFVFQDSPLHDSIGDLIGYFSEMKTNSTVVASAAGGPFTDQQTRELQETGIPVIPSARRLIKALGRIMRYSHIHRSG